MTAWELFEKWWENPNTVKRYTKFANAHHDIPTIELRDIIWVAFSTGYNLGYVKGVE